MIQIEDSQYILQSPHSAVSVQLYSSFFFFRRFWEGQTKRDKKWRAGEDIQLKVVAGSPNSDHYHRNYIH